MIQTPRSRAGTRSARLAVAGRRTSPVCAWLAFLLLVLPAVQARADVEGSLLALEKQVAEQQRLNARLIDRLDQVEASNAELRRHLGDVVRARSDRGAPPEEIEVLQSQAELTMSRLDSMPSLGGYYDFEYITDKLPDSPGAFRQHHMTLFVRQEHQKFRLFSELEWEYGPTFEGNGTSLEVARGVIKAESAWAEYAWSDLLTVRAGLMLTPQHWNVHHWPNLVVSTRRPRMVRNIYPDTLTGLMVYGKQYAGRWGLSYWGYVANGAAPNGSKADTSDNKAIGGRVTFHLPACCGLDKLDLGLSRYTENPPGVERVETWGLDAQIRLGRRLEILGEFARRDSAEDRTGWYLQPSYRVARELSIFYRYDLLDIRRGDRTRENTLGLNYRPLPPVSIKLEAFHSDHSTSRDYTGLASSLSVLF